MEPYGALENIMKPYEALWSLVEAYETLYGAMDNSLDDSGGNQMLLDSFM